MEIAELRPRMENALLENSKLQITVQQFHMLEGSILLSSMFFSSQTIYNLLYR